jgi:hypothetical protein
MAAASHSAFFDSIAFNDLWTRVQPAAPESNRLDHTSIHRMYGLCPGGLGSRVLQKANTMTDQTSRQDMRLAQSTRVEGFSESVFAIVITLLVIEIHRPRVGPGELGAA